MELQRKKENLLIRLKNILNENEVKLWLAPHFVEERSNEESLTELASKYHQMLNTDQQLCLEMLQELQRTSVCRLKERNNFKVAGLATIRVRVSGKETPEFTVQIRLTDIGEDLKKIIADTIEVCKSRLKLISKGRVLVPERSLEAQNVKNGCTVLAIILTSESKRSELAANNNNLVLLEKTKSDLEFLISRNSKEYLRITNQLGVSLNIPPDEQKSLILAMALHKKGRKVFKKGSYSLALVFFLEADTEFKLCRCEILEKVDNYAILNLDIVWTYLHLQNLQCLPDAEDRLKSCEQVFLRTYGSNLERLESIKGTTGNESVLFVRLRLLQGILSYLINRPQEAIKKFSEVASYIQILKIDNKNVKTLCELGYSPKEVRLALRATFNNFDAAIDHIHNQREERQRMKKQEQIRSFADKHRCLNNDLINLTVLEQLHNTGYTRLLGVHALKNSNNRINDALVWIENFYTHLYNQYPPDMVDEIKKLEFNEPKVRSILKLHNYELNDLCIRNLLATRSTSFEEFLSGSLNSLSDQIDARMPGSSMAADVNMLSETATNEAKKEREALSRLQESISSDEDDYLDIDLHSEEKFLEQYNSLLA